MNFDELNPILKEHGASIGVPHDSTKHYSSPVEHVSDEEAVRKDHGVGIGVPYDSLKYSSGPIEHVSDEEAVRGDHGVGIGKKASSVETYGTDDKELKQVFQELLYADGVGEIKDEISKLPDATLIKIVEQRFRRSINKLQDYRSFNKDSINSLGKYLEVDFAILMESVKQKREIYSTVFNASNYMGEENITDVFGLLEAYKCSLEQVPVSIELIDGMTGMRYIDRNTGKVLDAMTGLEYIKEEAKKVALEKGINLDNKQIK